MNYLLDTDTCIGVLRQRPGMVQRLSQVSPTDCAVSMVTVYELFCGLAKAQDPAKERQKVERFISAVIELPLDRASAEAAAKVRAELETRGQPHWAVRFAHCGAGIGWGTYSCHQ
jgi:tRNA(fMet)-specific endonuclease VapC